MDLLHAGMHTITWTLVKNIALLTSVQVIVCLKKVQLGLKRSMKNWSMQYSEVLFQNLQKRPFHDLYTLRHSLRPEILAVEVFRFTKHGLSESLVLE